MKTRPILVMSLLASSLLAACSTMPQSNALDDAHARYNSASADPQIVQLAPLQLKEADDALKRADQAQRDKKDAAEVDSLAYVARKKVAIAEETARRKTAEATSAQAAEERNKVQLDQRTAEADKANQAAATARQAATDAQQSAADAQQSEAKKSAALAAANAAADVARQQAADAQAQANANADQNSAKMLAMQAELDAMQAKKTDHGMVITMGDVLFDTARAQLKPGGTRNLQKLADFMKEYPERKVGVEGFTDSVGNDDYNQALSKRRADSVRSALLGMGIDSDRVSTRGYGESLPVASNDTKAGRQLNRRVEIVLSDEQGTVAQH
jgi:outer membrane protein OmpA-like peptidoglycan-associated protein